MSIQHVRKPQLPGSSRGPTGSTQPWDALESAPYSPVRARVAERLFRHAVRRLPVRIALPGGQRLGVGGPRSPLMRIERPANFFHRLGVHGKIGFGESYMAGDWSSPDPADLLAPFAARMSTLVPRPLQWLRHWVDASRPGSERGTSRNAAHNISQHYDLSNDVFAAFLDETMTYSSALFDQRSTDLATAQRRKIDTILDTAGVGAGTNLMEIGTGWGSLATRAAARGARVTTLTLSAEQQRLARQRATEAGLGNQIDVQLRDYRHARGRYDAVVSIEMIEAVGREFWPTYFRTIDRLLLPGGRVALQAITMPHDRMLATRRSYTWVHKYIFPGGMLPSLPAIDQDVAAHTNLVSTASHPFAASYAETLRQWRERFNRHWDDIAALGFSDMFRRMWEFYLAYSEAGFRSGYLGVWRLGLHKPAAH